MSKGYLYYNRRSRNFKGVNALRKVLRKFLINLLVICPFFPQPGECWGTFKLNVVKYVNKINGSSRSLPCSYIMENVVRRLQYWFL